ncbi:hypothetical protein PRIPAC_71097 [Pristionchus pacificus]|uniref:Uncharacterized protein n=1 Tax=Pristionchus pacificus TaxID=54126 RepID=A0A2A6CS13_PRIPA|nr:hypothetical protein PRIPAC_71097 [Pristionchus pacificus]|eukprot:PDM81002.1 hypothetical protein PRIPAC_36005 [Pristionchus pacificus]
MPNPSDSSHSLSTANSHSITRLDTKMIDLGTIPIPDGEVTQIQLSIVLDDHEQAIEYIRKMRFHFDVDVDSKN